MQYYAERELYHICPPAAGRAPAGAACGGAGDQLEEVRLRLGYPAAMLSRGRETPLTGAGGPLLVTSQLLRQLLDRVTDYSAYAAADYLRAGFITAAGGHRVGFCGQAVLEAGRLRTLQAFSSASIPRGPAGARLRGAAGALAAQRAGLDADRRDRPGRGRQACFGS